MLSVALVACTAKQPKMEDECLYSPAKTHFAFWSNVAEQMEVLIYDEADSDLGEAITLKKGEAIGQGVFSKYFLVDGDKSGGKRTGGFGSTDK